MRSASTWHHKNSQRPWLPCLRPKPIGVGLSALLSDWLNLLAAMQPYWAIVTTRYYSTRNHTMVWSMNVSRPWNAVFPHCLSRSKSNPGDKLCHLGLVFHLLHPEASRLLELRGIKKHQIAGKMILRYIKSYLKYIKMDQNGTKCFTKVSETALLGWSNGRGIGSTCVLSAGNNNMFSGRFSCLFRLLHTWHTCR